MKAGDLEIAQDMKFERRDWFVQRVCWTVLAILLILALTGLTGRGPLAEAEVRTEGLRITYPRFARQNSPADLVIESQAKTIWISRSYLDQFLIENISPTPAESASEGADLRLDFTQPSRVSMSLRPKRPGVMYGQIRSGSVSLTLRAIVLP